MGIEAEGLRLEKSRLLLKDYQIDEQNIKFKSKRSSQYCKKDLAVLWDKVWLNIKVQ